jgi:hypothetical protein
VKVGYNPAWGATIIVIAAACTVLGLWVTALGDFSPLVFFGPVLVLLGILQLTRPYFTYDPTTRTISVKGLIGPMSRDFGGAKGGHLSVQGDRIVYTRPDGKMKAPVSRGMSKREDWDAVVAHLS